MKKPAAFLQRTSMFVWTWPILSKVTVASVVDNIREPGFQEQLDVTVHRGGLNVVESEYICVRSEGHQSKSRSDPRFWPAGDEELDEGDLVHVAGEHGEKRRCRFLVLVGTRQGRR
jgi:hypothetical protein